MLKPGEHKETAKEKRIRLLQADKKHDLEMLRDRLYRIRISEIEVEAEKKKKPEAERIEKINDVNTLISAIDKYGWNWLPGQKEGWINSQKEFDQRIADARAEKD